MKDIYGNEVKVGDTVLFSSKAQGECSLSSGNVIDIVVKNSQIVAKIKKFRGALNTRRSSEIVNMSLFEKNSPELFLEEI